MSNQSIGVEIHPLGVRTARVSATPKGIVVHQVGEAAFGGSTPFTALRVGALPDGIESVLDARQFRGRDVVVIVDHPSAFLSTFDLAQGFTEELSASIKWYGEQYVPYPVDQAALDFRLRESPYGGQTTVQLIAVENAVLTTVMELLPPKRIKVRQIDGVPYALSRLYRTVTAAMGAPPEPAVLVHASGASGYVVVTRNGVVETMRHVRLGDASVIALADKVRETCLYYEVRHPVQSVQAAYATPTTLAADGAQGVLSSELGVDVEALDLMPHVTFAGGSDAADAPQEGPRTGWAERFALAIGAAC